MDIRCELKAAKRYLHDTVFILIIINMVLACVALFRDMMMASYLGTSYQADALILALFIPDTVGNNLLAVSIGISCIPVFARLYVNNQSERLFSCLKNTVLAFLIMSLLLLAFFYHFGDEFFRFFASGLSTGSGSLCLGLFYIILPTIVLFPLVTIGSSFMQVLNRFVIPAFAPVLYNVVFLSGILWGYIFHIPVESGVYLVAASITAGVLAMVLLVWVNFIGSYFRKKEFDLPRLKLVHVTTHEWTDLREISATFVPYLLILTCTQSILLVERYLASHLEVGAVAGLNYAYRIAQFPVWVFVAAVCVVLLPSLSKSKGLGQDKNLAETFSKALWLVLVITVPLCITLFFLREPLVMILLQRGAFDVQSFKITSGILSGYSLTVVGQAMAVVGLRFFLAQGQMVYPLLAFLFSALVNIGADFYFVERVGSAGLGYGAAIGSFINAVLIYFYIQKKLNLSIRTQAVKAAQIISANIPVFLILILSGKAWDMLSPGEGSLANLAYGFIVLLFVLTAYLFALRHFKII